MAHAKGLVAAFMAIAVLLKLENSYDISEKTRSN